MESPRKDIYHNYLEMITFQQLSPPLFYFDSSPMGQVAVATLPSNGLFCGRVHSSIQVWVVFLPQRIIFV